ncbi:unnamed protein product [Lathyrus sativus]|nr:unnamed protein product [Lathyrus sativus]
MVLEGHDLSNRSLYEDTLIFLTSQTPFTLLPLTNSSKSLMDSSLPSFNSASSSSSWVSFPSVPSKRVSNENMQEFFYLQNGGDCGLALLKNATVFLSTLTFNPTFLSAISVLLVTQSTKVFLKFYKEREWDFELLLASQGMPSTRSALCSALTTSVALTHGVAGSLFPISLGLSVIAMCDAVSARRHVGCQALAVNGLLDELFTGPPASDEKIDEDVGDTLPQVFTGALIGSAVAVLCSLGLRLLRGA